MSAPDPLFYNCEGFEQGGTLTVGTPEVPPRAGWTFVSDGHGHSVSYGYEGSVSESSNYPVAGDYGLRVNPTAGWAGAFREHLNYDIDEVLLASTDPNPVIWSLYFRLQALPDSDCWLFYEKMLSGLSGQPSYLGLSYNSATGALRPFARHFLTPTFSLTDEVLYGDDGFVPKFGKTYLLDMRIARDAGLVEWQVDGNLQPKYEAPSIMGVRSRGSWIGNHEYALDEPAHIPIDDPSSTYDLYVDQWVVTKDLGDDWIKYPIGPHTTSCDDRALFFLQSHRDQHSLDQLRTGS